MMLTIHGQSQVTTIESVTGGIRIQIDSKSNLISGGRYNLMEAKEIVLALELYIKVLEEKELQLKKVGV